MATTAEPHPSSIASAAATASTSSSPEAAQKKLTEAEKVLFGCEWCVYEFGIYESSEEYFAKGPGDCEQRRQEEVGGARSSC